MLAWARNSLQYLSPLVATLAIGTMFALVALVLLAITDTLGVPAAIITAAIPVSLGLIGQFVSSDRQHKREIEAKLRERKSEVYEGFIKFWMDTLMIKENRENLQQNPNQAVREMNEFSKPMMLWASNEVVQSYANFRRRFNQPGQDRPAKSGIDLLVHFEEMLFLMRRDMGHDPKGFRQLDLLSFFVNDIHLYEEQVDK